ncbi:MAG: hypothetical protein ACK5CL_01655 [Sphingomonadales bacterium]
MNASHGHILFICGGKWQLPWMRYLKNKGHQIVLADPNENPPCAALADIHIRCDARDVEGIYREVQNRGLKIDFVTSEQTDVSTQTVAALSAMLGTYANSPEAVERFANKATAPLWPVLMRAACLHFARFIARKMPRTFYAIFRVMPC